MQTNKNGSQKPRFNAIINETEITVSSPNVTGLELFTLAGISNPSCHDLFLIKKENDFERISLDERVNIANSSYLKFITKPAEFITYTVNSQLETTDKKELTPNEILQLAGIDVNCNFLILIKPDGTQVSYANKPLEVIKLLCTGMNFISRSTNSICDIEECHKTGVIPVISYRYIIKINSQTYTVDRNEMTGREILALINETPEKYYLRYKHKNGSTKVEPDEVIDFTQCGVERFSAKAKNCTEGYINRRDFNLPEADIAFLQDSSLNWETVSSGSNWLIIRDYIVPEGYTVSKVDVAINIPANYPISPLDMFYLFPGLGRTDHKPIGALSVQSIEGKSYQRWSRHRTHLNQWVPGEDGIATHLELMDHSLLEEFSKR